MTKTTAATAAPVFILGSPRSGTSMLHWALLQHADLWGSEESEFLLPIARAITPAFTRGMQFTPHSWLHQQNVTRDEFSACVGAGLSALYLSRSGGRRWVEQTPSYSTVAGELAAMFPDAQFLHIVRDGRQVADSMARMWDWSIDKSARQWRDHVTAVLELEQQQPARVLRFHYENLVADPEQQLQAIFGFLALDLPQESIDFIQAKPINTAPGTDQQASTDKLKPRWQQWSAEDQQSFYDNAGELLSELGYE